MFNIGRELDEFDFRSPSSNTRTRRRRQGDSRNVETLETRLMLSAEVGAGIAGAAATVALYGDNGLEQATWECLESRPGYATYNIAVSPDSSRLATGGTDATVKVLDARTGNILLTLQHGDTVQGVAFSPDGKFLASVSPDRTLKEWDFATGALRRELSFGGGVYGVQYSQSGKFLITNVYSRDGGILLINRETGEQRLLPKIGGDPDAFAITSDAAAVVYNGDIERNASLYSLQEGRVLRTFAGPVTAVAVSTKGIVAVGREDGTVSILFGTTVANRNSSRVA